eukprot:427408-Rhodomonas_salina.2
MITPLFSARQDDTDVLIVMRTPYVKADDLVNSAVCNNRAVRCPELTQQVVVPGARCDSVRLQVLRQPLFPLPHLQATAC